MAENGDIGKYQILKKLNDRNSVFVVRILMIIAYGYKNLLRMKVCLYIKKCFI